MAAGTFVSRFKLATSAAVLPALVIVLGMPAQVRAGCAPPPIVLTASRAQSKSASWAAIPQGIGGPVGHDGKGQKLVGLWEDTYTDTNGNPTGTYQFEVYHDDQTEIENDTAPTLTGNVCLGTWKKLQGNTYGLVHPFFDFQDVNSNGEGTENTEGQPDGTSAFYACNIELAKDGNSFQSKCHLKVVAGFDPFNSSAAVLGEGDFGIQGKRIAFDQTLIP
jgi:hypothetical protein